MFPYPINDGADNVMAALLGVAVGDALGVPAEFRSRSEIAANPITDMIGYGTYNLPPGTWSDDSSMTFCLAEALTEEFDLNNVATNFVKWLHEDYWTARGFNFDVGNTTRHSIERIIQGISPEFAGGAEEYDNGNGSLMRILPLLFYIAEKPIEERFEFTKQVSSITHRHIRSVIACFYYLEFARLFFYNKDKFEIYTELKEEIPAFLLSQSIDPDEIDKFRRLLVEDIFERNRDEIRGNGYVVHTLEASIWCLLSTSNYKDAVLKAVNLGEDTDTTAAITGGLAGIYYGLSTIPGGWLAQIARYDDIVDLAERVTDKLRE